LRVHLLQEGKQRFLAIVDGRGAIVLEDGIDERAIAEQLRRDRGVGSDSKGTRVSPRGERRNQLALARRQRRRSPHDALRELCEVLRAIGLEREEMRDLRNRLSGTAHLADRVGPRADPVVFLDCG